MLINKVIRGLSTKSNYYFVTTPIFYVNAAPHIGHLYSAVIADAISRYQNLKNSTKVIFSTGTDEHGTKIQQAAANNNVATEQYCDNISGSYKNMFDACNINHTDFIRTTESRHKNAVHHFWNKLNSKGHISSSQYSGWYCVSDETFLTESQLKTNPDGSKNSLESGHTVEWTEEVNYMFPLGKFQEDVIYWLKKTNKIKPAKFEKILLDYLSEPLPDVSISRPTSRVHWGIPVPDDSSQTIYVWLDALVNYLTCTGYPDTKWEETWPPNVQVLGKDILKFHGIYWPAFLIAAGLEPPNCLLVHSHWTVDGQKMSKSKFNVVDPNQRAEVYTMEGLRYFLLREGVAHSDGNYSDTKLLRILNSELADTLGNLLSRACAKTLNPGQIYPKIDEEQFNDLICLDATKRLLESLIQLPEKCTQHYDAYNFYSVVDQVMSTLHAANNFFEFCKPWELKKKSSVENVVKLETIIALTMDTLRVCGIILQPIIPDMSKKLLDKLCVPSTNRYWKDLKLSDGNVMDGQPISKYLNNRNDNLMNKEKLLATNTDAVLFRRILLKQDKDKDKNKSQDKGKVKKSQ